MNFRYINRLVLSLFLVSLIGLTACDNGENNEADSLEPRSEDEMKTPQTDSGEEADKLLTKPVRLQMPHDLTYVTRFIWPVTENQPL